MSGNHNDPPPPNIEGVDRIVRDMILENNESRTHRDYRDSIALPADPSMTWEEEQEQEDTRQRTLQRMLRRQATNPTALFVRRPDGPSLETLPRERIMARIARMTARRERTDRIIERARTPQAGETNTMLGLTDLHSAGRRLEEASSNLRALLETPVEIPTPDIEAQEYSGEAEQNPRAKRRKLEEDRVDSEFKGFSYGKYGQVEPGKLKMEIVSCDGGIFQENQGGNYAAENILRNDNSVYCTKDNRCNLVLRHQGATVFCLKELVIKAPHSGYTAPIQEGMVFISMTSDDLLNRTAQYQIQYSPPRNPRSATERANQLPPIMSIRHNNDGSMTTAQVRARRLYDIGLQDEDCDYRTAQIPSDFTANAPPFQVTTECSDSEDDTSPHNSQLPPLNVHRVRGLRFEDSDTSDEELHDHPDEWHENYLMGIGQSPRPGRRETASNITLSEGEEGVAPQEAPKATGGNLMSPHARFFIERDMSKCTVKFDPPVSGRFILLKMWSPQHSPSGNIDIQSVVAKGYAGPRFFPAVALR